MSKRQRPATPINVAIRFAAGYWVGMCAEHFGVSEATIEIQLMNIAKRYLKAHNIRADRKCLRKRKKGK